MARGTQGIEHKCFGETRIAGFRRVLAGRDGIRDALSELRGGVPEDAIAGPPFCIIQFVTSVKDGYDAEVGVPVSRDVESGEITTRSLPALDVLSLVHDGPVDTLGESYGALYGHASGLGIISDEFCREVYADWGEDDGNIELQFVIHRWDALLEEHATRALGGEAATRIVGAGRPDIDTQLPDRFRWVKSAIERIDEIAGDHQRYDILSSCAHVFPAAQVDKLRDVFEKARAETGDGLEAVDAVLEFIEGDPGWGAAPTREGRVLRTSKPPRDKAAYEKAETDAERRSAYCFCPIVRERLEEGMPITFCYCGAGWFRRQWEGATGRPVTVEVVRSVLKGDDECSFAITLSDDI